MSPSVGRIWVRNPRPDRGAAIRDRRQLGQGPGHHQGSEIADRDTANPCVVLAGLTCLAALTDEPEFASRACRFLGAARRETGDRRIIRVSAVPPDRPARAASD
jgi:hypothetical protein